MNEVVSMTDSTGPGPMTAGALLRQAREARGLHLAALAATMKIAPAKLEALEADRFDQLPDATFVRALALAVCRKLKIDDAQAVLDLLPRGDSPAGLERVSAGLNTPFREHVDRADPWSLALSRGPLVWAGGLLLLAAVAVYVLPSGSGWMHRAALPALSAGEASAPQRAGSAAAAAEAASAASAAWAEEAARVVAMAGVPETGTAVGTAAIGTPASAATVVSMAPATSSPASVPTAATATTAKAADRTPASAPAAGAADSVASLRAREASWVEVRDGDGAVLLARTLQPGESVALNGALPLRFKIGNAAGTELLFRSQPVNLAAASRDNVARLELK